jgi:hypothetical protein
MTRRARSGRLGPRMPRRHRLHEENPRSRPDAGISTATQPAGGVAGTVGRLYRELLRPASQQTGCRSAVHPEARPVF